MSNVEKVSRIFEVVGRPLRLSQLVERLPELSYRQVQAAVYCGYESARFQKLGKGLWGLSKWNAEYSPS